MRPLSRGYVLVCTPDPHDQPAINPCYLAEDTDQRAIVGGLKFLRRLFAAPALAKHIIGENLPGPGVQSDDELLDYARSNGSTVYHASCSCMMGNHGMSSSMTSSGSTRLRELRIIEAAFLCFQVSMGRPAADTYCRLSAAALCAVRHLAHNVPRAWPPAPMIAVAAKTTHT